MSADTLGTSWDQCRSMVQYSYTSTETRRLVRTDSPGRPPRLSHSSWNMSGVWHEPIYTPWCMASMPGTWQCFTPDHRYCAVSETDVTDSTLHVPRILGSAVQSMRQYFTSATDTVQSLRMTWPTVLYTWPQILCGTVQSLRVTWPTVLYTCHGYCAVSETDVTNSTLHVPRILRSAVQSLRLMWPTVLYTCHEYCAVSETDVTNSTLHVTTDTVRYCAVSESDVTNSSADKGNPFNKSCMFHCEPVWSTVTLNLEKEQSYT